MRNTTKEEYETAAKISLSYAGMCRYLGLSPRGGNYATIKKKIREYNIDISHFTGKGWNVGLRFRPQKTYKLEEVLQKDFPYNTQRLKNRLFESGLKEKKCECCGLDAWNGKEIPLEIHHMNGDRTDNRIENLQILCPNCHAQTDGYRGKNENRYEKKKCISDKELKEKYEQYKEAMLKKREVREKKRKQNIRYCKHCGKELTSKQKVYCSCKCAHAEVSKKPSDEVLNKKIKELNGNMSAVGRFYNVSETAVRKWLKLNNARVAEGCGL